MVIVPENAEKEIGFPFWLMKVWNIAKNSGAKMVFYTTKETQKLIKEIQLKSPIECEFLVFDDWDDFLILTRDFQKNDNLIIVLSRKDKPSYNNNMAKIPTYLNKYFRDTSYILIYPMQTGVTDNSQIDLTNATFIEPMEKLDEIGKTIGKIFRRK